MKLRKVKIERELTSEVEGLGIVAASFFANQN